jgi:predicted AlkP superfamily pyrophosphatase or phosphodiesterase
VLLLSIDQGRAEYLERFRPALTGGLRLLLEQGVVFMETHHGHAWTVTAPGHASLATGRFPSHSGIVDNDWYDRGEKRNVYCVEDPDSPVLPVDGSERKRPAFLGRSPRRLRENSLGDWMKDRDRRSKVYAVAGKDRSSILMGGKEADGAFWFDGELGQWVTSRYYMKGYPAWVLEFHQKRFADAYFGTTWEPLPIAESVLSSMGVEPSRDGVKDFGIPRVIGRGTLRQDAGFYQELFETPFLEPYLLAFAERLVLQESLGEDEATDFLALGFSSIDSVGHDYGPNSRELFDAILRLDRELLGFFQFLERRIGAGQVGVALSGDHGVAPLPEHQIRGGLPGGRITAADRACIARAVKSQWFLAPFYFDDRELQKEGIPRGEAEARIAEELLRCSPVAHVWTRTQVEAVEKATGPADPMLLRYARSFYPGRSPDLFIQLSKGLIDERDGTTHGSPYEYDTHVPGILWWPGILPRTIETPILTVDIPVTIATLLDLAVPRNVDGVSRVNVLRRSEGSR